MAHRDHRLSYFTDETLAGELIETLERPWYRSLIRNLWMTWEVEADVDSIVYYFWAQNEDVGNEIRSKILGEHPHLEIHKDTDCMILNKNMSITATNLKLKRDFPIMIKTFFNQVIDSQSSIVNSLVNLNENEQVMFQLLMKPAKKYQKYFDKAMNIVKKWDNDKDFEKMELFQKSIYSKQAKLLADCELRIVAISENKKRSNQLVNQLGRSFGQFSSEALNGFEMREHFLHIKSLFVSDWRKRRFPIFRRKLKRTILNIEELSGIMRVPSQAVQTTKLKRLELKNIEPPSQIIAIDKEVRKNPDAAEHISLGKNTYQMRETRIYLAVESLKRHLFVEGGSGSGKTVFLQNLAHDIASLKIKSKRKVGFFLIDPHGELSKKIISGLPDQVLKDVNYIKPDPLADKFFPMNVFDIDFNMTPDSLSKNIADVLKRIWPEGWGVRPDRNLLNAGIALDYIGEANILNINKLLSNYVYCKSVADALEGIEGYEEVYETINELAQLIDPEKSNNAGLKRQHRELTDSTRNKLENFSLSRLLSNSIGAETSGFRWRTWMDEGKITILDLSAIQSESEKKMYGSMALTLNLQAAFSRQDLIEKGEDLPIYPIIVDELPTFIENNLKVVEEMADRTRFVNVPLIGAAQGLISQLPLSVAQAITRNFGSVISYQINNYDDAELLAKYFNHEEIEAKDILNTPENYAYMTLNVGRKKSRTFSGLMNPPYAEKILPDKVRGALERTLEGALEVEKKAKEARLKKREMNFIFDEVEETEEFSYQAKPIENPISKEEESKEDEKEDNDLQFSIGEHKSEKNLWDQI